MSTQEAPHVRRCMTTTCRVETFKASHMLPLNGCPVCLMPGVRERAK